VIARIDGSGRAIGGSVEVVNLNRHARRTFDDLSHTALNLNFHPALWNAVLEPFFLKRKPVVGVEVFDLGGGDERGPAAKSIGP